MATAPFKRRGILFKSRGPCGRIDRTLSINIHVQEAQAENDLHELRQNTPTNDCYFRRIGVEAVDRPSKVESPDVGNAHGCTVLEGQDMMLMSELDRVNHFDDRLSGIQKQSGNGGKMQRHSPSSEARRWLGSTADPVG